MTLKSVISGSVNKIFLRSTNEFAEEVTYIPAGETDGFTCRVVAGSPTPMILSDGDVLDRRTMQLVASLADLSNGITERTATVRKPRRGDQVVFAEPSDYAGTWTVMTAQPDGHGAVDLEVKLERIHSAGGTGTQKVE